MNSALYWELLPVVLSNPACQLWLVPLYSSRASSRQWCSLLALMLMLFLILKTPSKNEANSQQKNSALLRQTMPIYTKGLALYPFSKCRMTPKVYVCKAL